MLNEEKKVKAVYDFIHTVKELGGTKNFYNTGKYSYSFTINKKEYNFRINEETLKIELYQENEQSKMVLFDFEEKNDLENKLHDVFFK